jgi:hypothetical protein
MDVVLVPITSQGILVLTYLDDWLVCAQSRAQATADPRIIVNDIQDLSLTLNRVKNNLTPS